MMLEVNRCLRKNDLLKLSSSCLHNHKSEVLYVVYVVFAFIGLGREPFVWSLVLGAAGLPLYWFMRRRRASELP